MVLPKALGNPACDAACSCVGSRNMSSAGKADVREDFSWATSGGDSFRRGFFAGEVALPLSLEWTFAGCGWIAGGIVVSGSTAVFGDRSGKLFAVDVGDGRKLWEYELRGLTVGTPTIQDDRVFAGSSALAVCVDLATGVEVWKSRTRGSGEAAAAGCALCAGGRVFFCDERLAIFNAEDGRPSGGMFAGFEAYPHTGACSRKEFVYIPTQNEIRRLSLETGTVTGSVTLEKKLTAGPMLTGELLIYGTSQSRVEAVDLKTLARVWVFEVEDRLVHQAETSVVSRPAFAQGRVFFGGPDGNIYALHASTGERIWRYRTGARLESPPLVVGDVVYVLAAKGVFLALSATEGHVLWKHNADRYLSPASCTPAPDGQRVLVGWDKLYAFGPAG